MKFFTGCIKKYRLITAISVILLFAEAVLCLYVPFLLGNIIGIGIQCKGFADDYPLVISKNAFALFFDVLPESQGEKLSRFYELCEDTPEGFSETYKTRKDCYYIREDSDREELTDFFRNAVFSAVLLARGMPETENYDIDELLGSVSLNSIYVLANRYKLTEDEKTAFYGEAAQIDTAVKVQAASILLPYIYEDAGLDCDFVQSEYIKNNSILTVAVLLLQMICAGISAYFIARLSGNIEKEMRMAVVRKSLAFSKEEAAKIQSSAVMRYYESEPTQAGIAVNLGFRLLFNSLFIGIIGSVITFMKSAVFGAFIIGSSFLIVMAICIIYKITYRRYYRMQENYADYANILKTNLDRMFTVRMMNAEKTEKSRIAAKSKEIFKDESFVMRSVFTALGTVGLAVNILTALIIIAGGNSMLQADITLGNIITYLQYSLITVSSFMMLGAAVIFMPSAVRALKGLDDLLSIEQKDGKLTDDMKNADRIESIRFDRVKLFESSREVSFEVKKGQVLALCGTTGSGKSLLADALLREFTPFSGEIYVNSDNIKALNARYPSRYIALATSKPVLYSASVRINMYLAGARKDDDVLLKALDMAGCGFITENKNCLDIYLKNAGESFSGGQRSRLSLAGVLAKKANVYIFDDCLVSVDRETRDGILKNIYALKKDAAVILISQDPDDIKDADIKIEI